MVAILGEPATPAGIHTGQEYSVLRLDHTRHALGTQDEPREVKNSLTRVLTFEQVPK